MRSWLPTSSPSPPQLAVEVAQSHLRRLLEPLVAVDGRAVLTVGDDALVATRVDDAMVTAVEATLHQSMCRQYETAPGSIEIDPVALLDVIAAERDDGELAHFSYAPEESTLRLALPSFVHTQAVDVDVTVERPDVNGPPDGATTYHTRDDLAHALEYFADHSSVVAFRYDEIDDGCYLEKVSTDEAVPEATTRYRYPREQLASSSTPDPVRSAFSTAKLRTIVEAAPPETVIRADHAEAFPIQLAWDLTGGYSINEGTLTEVTALLAPYEVPGATTEEQQTPEVERDREGSF